MMTEIMLICTTCLQKLLPNWQFNLYIQLMEVVLNRKLTALKFNPYVVCMDV